jgi:LPXTG-site transpeptidase (sortase) family protein
MKRGWFLILLLWFLGSVAPASSAPPPMGLLLIPSLQMTEPIYERMEANGVLDLSILGTHVAHYGGTGWLNSGYSPIILVGHLALQEQRPGAFYRLSEVQIGARIVVSDPHRSAWFRVTASYVTDPSDAAILQVRPVLPGAEQLVLIACEGADGAQRRIVIATREF